MVKAILLVCATALFAEAALAQCWGRNAIAGPYRAGGWGCGGYDADIAAASSLNAACGGVLGVSTGSCSSTGLSVASENVYEGPLAVAGNLPFLGTVGLEGVFPSAGAGGVSYGCGDGALGITAEGAGFGGLGYAGHGYNGFGYAGLGYDGLGYNGFGYRGFAGRGCGCGSIY